jgi:hypothetical protein
MPPLLFPVAIFASALFANEVVEPPLRAGAAPVPQIAPYVSAFDGYRRFADQPVENWQAANDLVRSIGGWKAYARDRQSETRPSASRASSQATGHDGQHE